MSVLQASTSPSTPSHLIAEAGRNYVSYWPIIMFAMAVFSLAPSLAGRFLVPWSLLEGAPEWLRWGADTGWTLLRTAMNATVACILVTAVLQGDRWPSASLVQPVVRAIVPASFVAILLLLPTWIFDEAARRLLHVAVRSMTSSSLALALAVRALLDVVLQVALVAAAGAATVFAVTKPREGAFAALRAGYRTAKGWRWTLAMTFLGTTLAHTAVAIVAMRLTPIGPEASAAAETAGHLTYAFSRATSFLTTPLLILILVAVYRRSLPDKEIEKTFA